MHTLWEQENSPTEQFGNTVFETIRQQILFQTLFRPEFTRSYQGLFKSFRHIFFKLSNRIFFYIIQSHVFQISNYHLPNLALVSGSKMLLVVVSQKFTSIFILNLNFQKLLNILFENISLNCCTYNTYYWKIEKCCPTFWISFLKEANLL